jgi:hypothetical protein
MKLRKWFQIYNLVLITCASVCTAVLAVIRYYDPPPIITDKDVACLAAIERVVTSALPPGWTTRRSLYISHILDAEGNRRAFAYLDRDTQGRALLIAAPMGTRSRAASTWKLADPAVADGFKAWLAGISADSKAGQRLLSP